MNNIAKSPKFEKLACTKFIEEGSENLNQGMEVAQSAWMQRSTVIDNCLSQLEVKKVPQVNLGWNGSTTFENIELNRLPFGINYEKKDNS